VHSSDEWRHEASVAFQMLSAYIAELNADVSLYQSLVPITSNASIMSSLSEEEKRMATMLQKEFERDSIHLPDDERAQVRQLNAFVVQLETMFTENLTEHKRFNLYGNLAKDVYRTIPKHIMEQNVPQKDKGRNGSSLETSAFVTLTTEPHIANSLLKYSPSSALRREVFMEANTQCPHNLEVLDALIQQRHALAVKMGYPSYAHYFLSDKMASSPENVVSFLNHVSNASNDRYLRDLEMLSTAKAKIEGTLEPLQPWDLSYYISIVKNHLCEGYDDAGKESLAGYFTLDHTLEGMKSLMQRLFGIHMVEVPMKIEERWDNPESQSSIGASNGIRKFEFYQEDDGKPLGTMYLDLYPRPGKYTHAAHFTVRCGCESKLETSNGETEYQLPIVALVFNLSPPQKSLGSTAVLSHSEVETIFHEFGHAMHSLLSRTSFQHLSGTRSAMDFVETPSHLMEYYVWNEEFLQMIGRHYQTGDVIPEKNIKNLIKSRTLFKALEVQSQW
jgi:intermediate peptidase